MKIAVTYENGEVFQHFGRTQSFKIYEIVDGKIVASQVIDNGGFGHGSLAGYLKDNGVEALICGGSSRLVPMTPTTVWPSWSVRRKYVRLLPPPAICWTFAGSEPFHCL